MVLPELPALIRAPHHFHPHGGVPKGTLATTGGGDPSPTRHRPERGAGIDEGEDQMARYIISNNTDFTTPFETANLDEAERLWGEQVRPGPDAGNRYWSRFVCVCDECGGEQDMTVDHITCHCR